MRLVAMYLAETIAPDTPVLHVSAMALAMTEAA
jgi:hypothetical protein